MKLRIGCAIITILLFSACAETSPPVDNSPADQQVDTNLESTPSGIGSCSPELGKASSEDEAIRQVLNSEGTYVVAQDIDLLMNLWSSDSQIADAKNTPNTQDDDQIWKDKDAIRHRYVRIVFPGAPSVAQPSNLDITINGSEAIVMATTNIGEEISPQGDEWRLVNENGCWLIKSLTYNLEEK